MHKAMMLLDIHFKIAYSAIFVFWRWLRSGCSEDLFARLILWTPKGGVKIYLLRCAFHNTQYNTQSGFLKSMALMIEQQS